MKNMKRLTNGLFWILTLSISTVFGIGIYQNATKEAPVSPQTELKNNLSNYQVKNEKASYMSRMAERDILVLRMPFENDTTQVFTDIVLAKTVDKFLTEALMRNVSLKRFLDLEFIAYDYIHTSNSNAITLGFQQEVANGKDYVVINSHGMMEPAKLEIVLYHELAHHLRQDGFHCESPECSLYMTPVITNAIVDSISKDRATQLNKMFNNIKKVHETRANNAK